MRVHVHSVEKLSRGLQFIRRTENKILLFMSFFIVSQHSTEHGSFFIATHTLRIHGSHTTHNRHSHLLRNARNYKNR